MSSDKFDDELRMSFDLKLLEIISHPVFIKNTEGIYIDCNEAFANFLKIDKKNIIGSTAFDLAPISLAHVYQKADHELFLQKKPQIYSASVLDHSQKLHNVEFSKFIIHDHQDALAGFIGIVKKIKIDEAPKEKAKLNLSQREIDVLALSAKGFSVKEIAQLLLISPHTVTTHFKSIFHKLNVKNKVMAILVAKEHLLIN